MHTDMDAHLIYTESKDGKLFLCWSDEKKEAAWILRDIIGRVNGHFGLVAYFDRDLAEKRAKSFGAKVKSETIKQ